MVFSRLQYASNKAAKKKLLHFDRDYIIYTTQLPQDVKRWKLILFTLLLGLFGGHYYYVGKFWKGLYMSLSFVYLFLCTLFNAQIYEYMENNYLFLPIGIYALVWLFSLVYVLTKKFKVPIYIDDAIVEEEKNNLRAEYDRLSKDIKEENQKLKKGQKKAAKTEVAEELQNAGKNAATSKRAKTAKSANKGVNAGEEGKK